MINGLALCGKYLMNHYLTMTMKDFKFPNALVIVVGFILVSGLMTYIIPKGNYERKINPFTQREEVVPGSYKTIEAAPLPVFNIFLSIPKGIVAGAEVVVLIFLVGGFFFVADKTGAFREGISWLISKVKGKEEIALVTVAFAFAVGGSLEGLEEEIIPMIPILLVLTRKLGFNAIVMVCISYGASMIGATFSPVNPFGAVIAHKLAELPFLSGAAFTLSVSAIAFFLWMVMVIRYANRHKVEKEKETEGHLAISRQNIFVLILVLAAFVMLISGMLFLNWGMNEISAEFFVMSVLVGLAGKLGINGTFEAYSEGFKEMTFAALIIGISHGISLVLKEGLILDTIIYGLFTPLQHLPVSLSAAGMMVSQAILHITVPSYSSQAVLTIPILIPLSDLIGLSRDICVLTFQYGAILMNLVIPTNGALMAILVLGGISYGEWIAFVATRMLAIFGLAMLAILAAVSLGEMVGF